MHAPSPTGEGAVIIIKSKAVNPNQIPAVYQAIAGYNIGSLILSPLSRMEILTIQDSNDTPAFEVFLNSISNELAAAICKKLQAYSEANDIYVSNSLKILKPKIWGYKGTIYKLRVDCGKESTRVLFAKNPHSDIVLLHGFVKNTQKTPKKDAKLAMVNYDRVKNNVRVTQLSLEKYSF